MGRGSIHHVGLTVSDVERSELAFYAPVLGFLGYLKIGGRADRPAFWRDSTGGPTLHLVASGEDFMPPASDHCAFSVASRNAVDRLNALLVELGIPVLSPPAEYPHFGDGHYAVFFRDPDGRLFEVLHRPASKDAALHAGAGPA